MVTVMIISNQLHLSDPWVSVSYDLSAYAGTVVNLAFNHVTSITMIISNGDNAYVDNILIDVVATPVYGCTDPTAVNFDPNVIQMMDHVALVIGLL